MKLRIFRSLNLLLLASLLIGCAGTLTEERLAEAPAINLPVQLPAAQDAFPQINERNPEVEAEYNPIAENEVLRLYLNEKTSAIILEDKRNNELWRTSPTDLQEDKNTTNVWKRQIEVPLQVAYVDAERSQTKNVKPTQSTQTYQSVQDGLKVSYTFPDDNLALDLIYTLQGDCMNVILPNSSIVEDGINSLVSIEMLPFFGATHDGEEGYIVYPDGSGAVMHFNTPRSAEVQKMVGIIYGSDASGGQSTGTGSSTVFRQPIPMPVFGLVKNNSGFVGIITQGDFDSGISLGRAGKGINYNHVWSQFIFRRQGRFSLTGGQPAWLYQPDRIPGDRQVRYCLLNGDQASYVGMAARYRDFLINERGAKRIEPQAPLMDLALFMGTERRNWILRDMISMTTFSQAGQILKDLADSGVIQTDIVLWNWDMGSISVLYPQRFPVDERLGGVEGMRLLAQDIHGRGQRLFLMSNFFTVAPGAKGVFPYLDAVRGVDGLPLGSNEQGYILNPEIALERYASIDLPKMKELGADGLLLNGSASMALPDKNSRFPLTREGFAATCMKIANLSSEMLGAVSMTGGNIYAASYSDRLDMVPMDSTHYDTFDETIPLYQIAIHGLVQYTGEPFNLISDSQRTYLTNIEYGAIPFFVLTAESSSKLARTNANDIFSSQYSFWKNEIIKQYQTMEMLAPLISMFITNHEKLETGVFQTTYEDGTRIIVNYTSTQYSNGSIQVPAQGFVMVKGD